MRLQTQCTYPLIRHIEWSKFWLEDLIILIEKTISAKGQTTIMNETAYSGKWYNRCIHKKGVPYLSKCTCQFQATSVWYILIGKYVLKW